MTPTEAYNAARLLKGVAYNLWIASLCSGPPRLRDLFEELRNPKPGDLVMETTTHGRPGENPVEAIGRLVSITDEPTCTREEWVKEGGDQDEPIPTHRVYTIQLVFDGRRIFRWTNASFVKVKCDWQAEEEQRRKDFAELDAAAASDPRRIEAQWCGEAAKAWWCNLSETERQQIGLMEPRKVFILGWKCGRAKAADQLKP